MKGHGRSDVSSTCAKYPYTSSPRIGRVMRDEKYFVNENFKWKKDGTPHVIVFVDFRVLLGLLASTMILSSLCLQPSKIVATSACFNSRLLRESGNRALLFPGLTVDIIYFIDELLSWSYTTKNEIVSGIFSYLRERKDS